MPRYLVERDFSNGFDSFLAGKPVNAIISVNEDIGVTWLCSYVTDDRRRTYCLFEAAGPEAIRKAARCVGLPIGSIHRISVFEPHAYRE